MTKSNKLTSIQVMRGLAVVLVLFFHATENLVAKGLNGLVLNSGQAGVDIFFIISGFIIFYSARNKFGLVGMTDFFKGRIQRIVPNYWFYTLSFAILLIIFPDKFERSVFDFGHLLHSLFFIPMIDNLPPLVSLGWTLNYEVYFYLIFLFSILLSTRYRLGFVLFMIFSIFILANNIGLNLFYRNDVVFEFILGAILYLYYSKAYREGFKISEISFYMLILVVAYFIGNVNIESRFLNLGVPSFIIMMLSLHVDFISKLGWMLEKIGEGSYSIYLSHAISMPFVIKLLLLFGVGFYLSMLLSIIFCLIVGLCAYQVFEKRFLDFSWWKIKTTS
ncbi:acyltransferase family protein [Serratia proteamaculans]|uniref:acyltransferase family protein n=1 Tax=Serratia proteamaculans TaxID=28151 RepID=UPI00217AC1A4|nr:acyltransferase [Serratia proteamaculans]CAI1564205.1 Uncharacterized protein conserved in bacteria [Serratia proteamaculans]